MGKLTHAMLAERNAAEQKDVDVYRIMRRWRMRVAGEGQSSVLQRERRGCGRDRGRGSSIGSLICRLQLANCHASMEEPVKSLAGATVGS